MDCVFTNIGRMNEEMRKKIKEVVEKYEIYKKNSHSKSMLTVAIPKATDFNSTVAIDLKIA